MLYTCIKRVWCIVYTLHTIFNFKTVFYLHLSLSFSIRIRTNAFDLSKPVYRGAERGSLFPNIWRVQFSVCREKQVNDHSSMTNMLCWLLTVAHFKILAFFLFRVLCAERLFAYSRSLVSIILDDMLCKCICVYVCMCMDCFFFVDSRYWMIVRDIAWNIFSLTPKIRRTHTQL